MENPIRGLFQLKTPAWREEIFLASWSVLQMEMWEFFHYHTSEGTSFCAMFCIYCFNWMNSNTNMSTEGFPHSRDPSHEDVVRIWTWHGETQYVPDLPFFSSWKYHSRHKFLWHFFGFLFFQDGIQGPHLWMLTSRISSILPCSIPSVNYSTFFLIAAFWLLKSASSFPYLSHIPLWMISTFYW